MGHSTSSGRQSGGVTRAPMSQQMIDDAINRVSGRALTSADRDQFERELELNAAPGNVIEARENNRWHSITSSYTRLENGMWHYERVNNDTGERYENRDVPVTTVASSVLGTGASFNEPTRWTFRRSGGQTSRGLSESSRRAIRAAEYSARSEEEERRRGQEAARNMTRSYRRGR